MAGLLAARVLTDHFDRVTVLERDELVDRPDFRKGVPQAHHVHALLARGARVMADLFPGLFDDLVDAGGRGTRMPQWLQDLGYGEVPVSTLNVNLCYATRIFKAKEGMDWVSLTCATAAPFTRSGGILPLEGGRWIATVWGYFGDHPSADPDSWLEFARSLPILDLYEALRDAEPLTPVALFKFPGHLRRHYERMQRFPEGLAVQADAGVEGAEQVHAQDA